MSLIPLDFVRDISLRRSLQDFKKRIETHDIAVDCYFFIIAILIFVFLSEQNQASYNHLLSNHGGMHRLGALPRLIAHVKNIGFLKVHALMDEHPSYRFRTRVQRIVDTDARARRRPATTKLCFQVIGKGDNDRDQFVFRVKRLRDTTLLQL